MITVSGAGWIGKSKYGCAKIGIRGDYFDTKSLYARLRKESIFFYPVKNFSRFDRISKMTCCCVALALKDAGIPYPEDRKRDVGIIGTNNKGSLKSNIDYFKDYIDCGRVLARGNLFIYTLPSSPLAEAAIHFGLEGPLFYMTVSGNRLAAALFAAGNIISRKEASTMLAIEMDGEKAICFVLNQEKDTLSGRMCRFDEALAITEKARHFDGIVRELMPQSTNRKSVEIKRA